MTYETYWTKEGAPYGYYDDYVIFESKDEKFQMLKNEFDFIFNQLHDNCWKKKTCKYIQIVKEWNEFLGFNDIAENPSIIQDKQDTIAAFSTLKGAQGEEFPGLKQEDLENLNAFLFKHQDDTIKIYQE